MLIVISNKTALTDLSQQTEYVIVIIHEFHDDTSLETKLWGSSKCHLLG